MIKNFCCYNRQLSLIQNIYLHYLYICNCGPECQLSAISLVTGGSGTARCNQAHVGYGSRPGVPDTYPPDIPILQFSVLHLRADSFTIFTFTRTRVSKGVYITSRSTYALSYAIPCQEKAKDVAVYEV